MKYLILSLSVELYCAYVNEGQQNKNFDMLENYRSICMTQKSYLLMVPTVTVYYCGNLHTDRLNVNEWHSATLKYKRVTLQWTNFATKSVQVTKEEWERSTLGFKFLKILRLQSVRSYVKQNLQSFHSKYSSLPTVICTYRFITKKRVRI